jgi:hypothetical protein
MKPLNAFTQAEREATLAEVDRHQAAGLTMARACARVRLPQATVQRWREWRAKGGAAAMDTTARIGRTDWASLLSDRALEKIRELVLKTDSVALAYEIFRGDPLCPPEVRAALEDRKSRQSVPMSLRRAAYITPEIKALHRGAKTYQLNGFTTLRDMSEIMPDGMRRQILPGDWWEMDDMSLNHPFYYEADCPACGANGRRDGHYSEPGPGCSKLAHRYGREVGRQSLWAIDLASCKPLGFDFIGRARDAYRAEDILRFLRKLFETYGLPRRGLRLERGIWMSKRIRGYEMKPGYREDPDYAECNGGYELPEMPDVERKVVVGGLEQLGLEIRYCYSPRQKGMIESSFDHLQSIANTIGDR